MGRVARGSNARDDIGPPIREFYRPGDIGAGVVARQPGFSPRDLREGVDSHGPTTGEAIESPPSLSSAISDSQRATSAAVGVGGWGTAKFG